MSSVPFRYVIRSLLGIGISCSVLAAQGPSDTLRVLPAIATTQLARSVEAAARHARHVWRDTAALNADGSVNAYVEISRGDRRKWELDMAANARAIDRVIPTTIGGYPVNYGFVPQTVSYDGDPFDALVLGPPLAGGRMVRGVIVGLMFMEDQGILDAKVVLALTGTDGRPLERLTPEIQKVIGDYFSRYKQWEPGKFTKVPGWGSIAEGLSHVMTTHAFFRECRQRAGRPCQLPE